MSLSILHFTMITQTRQLEQQLLSARCLLHFTMITQTRPKLMMFHTNIIAFTFHYDNTNSLNRKIPKNSVAMFYISL